jgi:hypothetical protein
MEGGDLHGPYERACSLAEQKARVAGVANPVSAWHTKISPTSCMSPATHERAQILRGAN